MPLGRGRTACLDELVVRESALGIRLQRIDDSRKVPLEIVVH